MVVSFGLAVGLLYMVVVLARGGGVAAFYSFLAALSVLAAAAGMWVGYVASYRLVTTMVQSLGGAGSTIVFFCSFIPTDLPAQPVNTGLGVITGVASAVPRIAEAGSAALMLIASLFVFEATRRGYLFLWAITAAPPLLTAAALLLGNAFAELYAPPPITDHDPSAPLQ